jgi:hypothetical protein
MEEDYRDAMAKEDRLTELESELEACPVERGVITRFMVQEYVDNKWEDYWLEKTLADARETAKRTKARIERPIRIMKQTIEEV